MRLGPITATCKLGSWTRGRLPVQPQHQAGIPLIWPLSSSWSTQTRPYGVFPLCKGSFPPSTLQNSTLVATWSHGHARKNTEDGDVGRATELGLCQPARTLGRSHLLHPVVHSLFGQADDCKGESQSPGKTNPWVNFHLSKHTGKQAHARVIFPWKTLDWPHLCRARTPVKLQGHFQAPDCAIISPCPPWASALPGDRRGKKGDTREWLRKSSTHLWPLPVGVNSFDVQRDGFHPAACRREHREMERLSEKPRGAGCSTPEPCPSPRGGTSQTARYIEE